MKINLLIFIAGLGILLTHGCEKGLHYEEVPEDIYNEVGLAENIISIESRELWTDNVYAVNFKQYTSCLTISYIDNYVEPILYTNPTDSPITIMEQILLPGESMTVQTRVTKEENTSAPEDTLYIIHAFASARAVHFTPQVDYRFDFEKILNDPRFSDRNPVPADVVFEERYSEGIQIDVNPEQISAGLYLKDDMACKVKPVDNAPELGTPGDYTVPRRYMVVNNNKRPDGSGQRERLYEIRMTFLP